MDKVPDGEGWKSPWRNSDWKLLKSDKAYKPTDSSSCMNTKEQRIPNLKQSLSRYIFITPDSQSKEKFGKEPQNNNLPRRRKKEKSRLLRRNRGYHLEVAQYILHAEKSFWNEREMKTFSVEEDLKEHVNGKSTLKCYKKFSN